MRNLSKRLWEIQRRERIYFWVEGRGGFWYFSTKLQINLKNSVQFSSVAQLCPTLCDPVNCSTPGLPVHHQLLEFTQTHVHQVDVPSSHLILCHPLLLLPPRICRFNPWVRKIPWRRKWHPIPVFLPGESHGQRSLEGYSPWGYKVSDMTEWLGTNTVNIPNTSSHLIFLTAHKIKATFSTYRWRHWHPERLNIFLIFTQMLISP